MMILQRATIYENENGDQVDLVQNTRKDGTDILLRRANGQEALILSIDKTTSGGFKVSLYDEESEDSITTVVWNEEKSE